MEYPDNQLGLPEYQEVGCLDDWIQWLGDQLGFCYIEFVNFQIVNFQLGVNFPQNKLWDPTGYMVLQFTGHLCFLLQDPYWMTSSDFLDNHIQPTQPDSETDHEMEDCRDERSLPHNNHFNIFLFL